MVNVMIAEVINDPWYKELEEHLGADFCFEAGFFQEEKPWDHSYEGCLFFLPWHSTVIQYSGAFHPFHDGHMACAKAAIDAFYERTGEAIGDKDRYLVLHVDHSSYRNSKGHYPDEKFKQAIREVTDEVWYKGFNFVSVFEDVLHDNCSRNFTRLYSTLLNRNNDVYFLSGGDRANYALSFINKGKCIIAGRDNHPNFEKYKALENDRLWFLAGNHPASSTQIRNSSQEH